MFLLDNEAARPAPILLLRAVPLTHALNAELSRGTRPIPDRILIAPLFLNDLQIGDQLHDFLLLCLLLLHLFYLANPLLVLVHFILQVLLRIVQ